MEKCSHLDICVGLLVETFMRYAVKDGDPHTLSKSEVKDLLKEELPTTLGKADEKEVDEMFKALDADGDGVVSFPEFVATVGAMAQLCHEHFAQMVEQAQSQMPV